MKVSFSGDVQCHNHQAYSRLVDGTNSRLLVGCNSIRFAADQAKGGVLVLDGDITHDQKTLSIDVLYHVYQAILYASTVCSSVIIVAGNHDQFLKNGEITALEQFGHMPNVTVVLNKMIVQIQRGFALFLLAHTEDHNYVRRQIAEWAAMDEWLPEQRILVAHQGIRGAILPGGHLSDADLKLEDLHPEAFAYVVLGDYHRPQNLADNTFYVGSPYQIDWGEAGDKKRILVYDTKSKDMESVLTGTPEFKLLSLSEYQHGHADNSSDYYKVTLAPNEAPIEVPHNVKFDWEESKEIVPELRLQGDFSIDDAVREWLAQRGRPDLIDAALSRLSEAA